ncbi:hypothetical protein LTR50_004221 [Elasticomyces elasticus]|nr:hypothetical protein LTR50_004221 [Elasticomyces elasticus]
MNQETGSSDTQSRAADMKRQNITQERVPTRLSTYSGAPSLRPSLAPTYTTTASQAPTLYDHEPHSRCLSPSMEEKLHRLSAPSLSQYHPNASTSTIASTDPKTQDLRLYSAGVQRLEDKRLVVQRYVIDEKKGEDMASVALGAKLERALGRRMTGQDFDMGKRKKGLMASEKMVQVEARS